MRVPAQGATPCVIPLGMAHPDEDVEHGQAHADGDADLHAGKGDPQEGAQPDQQVDFVGLHTLVTGQLQHSSASGP